MNIPGIENETERRLHLLWIIPFIIVGFIPIILWYGIKETFSLAGEIYTLLIDVWRGRFYSNRL